VLARVSFGIAAIMAGILVLAGYVSSHGDEGTVYPQATGEHGPAGLSRFYEQKLQWSTCGGSICTWVRVPLDYAAPQAETVRLRVKLRPATSDDASRHLFINPGGPGGSGVDFVDAFAKLTSTGVRHDYDIVGFDPRGVGQSTPLTCLKDKTFDTLIALDPSPDDPDEVEKLEHGFHSVGKACVKKSGALASHVSTEESARDLDILRALMGEKTLDYFGASYGTQLGATYAQLFPRKAGRLVLDGGVDPTLSKERQGFGQAQGFQKALTAFVTACVDTGKCPLGDDVEAGEDTIVTLVDSLDAKPLRTRGTRELTEASAVYGIAYALYDKDSWNVLATGLNRASFGDGTILLALADQYFGRGQDGTYRDNGPQAVYAIRCLDYPRAPSDSEIAGLLPSYTKASAVFGPVMAWTAAECQDWPAASKHPQLAVRAQGAAPILVIGTTRDPATPYAWSQALAKQLASGILITRKGDGHTGYGVGNACVDRAVDRYLRFGEEPDHDLTCDGGG
jgi:pimeloyl-ACP methyl ester carboxylesterase